MTFGGVNARTRGLDVIIQIMYPDTDHMLTAGRPKTQTAEILDCQICKEKK